MPSETEGVVDDAEWRKPAHVPDCPHTCSAVALEQFVAFQVADYTNSCRWHHDAVMAARRTKPVLERDGVLAGAAADSSTSRYVIVGVFR